MLEYSDAGLSARPAFFAPYNDITIIVEDIGKEGFYTQVLKCLLEDKLRLYKVLGVGGKEQVLRRFRLNCGSELTMPEFYLVDGDYDELLGRTAPASGRFYRLCRYDIESYLIEEGAISLIAEEQAPHTSASKFKDDLQVRIWKSEVVNASVRLVACAALLQRLGAGQTQLAPSIERYVSGQSTIPNKNTIESEIARVRQEQSVVDHQKFDALLEQMVSRMGTTFRERRRWISGKNILVPLVIRLLRQHTGSSLEKASLCFRLAKHCEFRELGALRDMILAAA